MLSNVTAKGQVTIPAELRARFHIMPNDRVDFMVDGERIVLMPVKPLKSLRGAVTAIATGGIAEERKQAKQAVAERIAEETK
jgi:AbrB family looped-hinge helix DNA binding protein